MIELRIQEVAKGKGITTIKGLAESAKLAYDTASDLWHGRMQRMDLAVLNRVCMTLDCLPGDLLVFTRDEETPEDWPTLEVAPA